MSRADQYSCFLDRVPFDNDKEIDESVLSSVSANSERRIANAAFVNADDEAYRRHPDPPVEILVQSRIKAVAQDIPDWLGDVFFADDKRRFIEQRDDCSIAGGLCDSVVSEPLIHSNQIDKSEDDDNEDVRLAKTYSSPNLLMMLPRLRLTKLISAEMLRNKTLWVYTSLSDSQDEESINSKVSVISNEPAVSVSILSPATAAAATSADSAAAAATVGVAAYHKPTSPQRSVIPTINQLDAATTPVASSPLASSPAGVLSPSTKSMLLKWVSSSPRSPVSVRGRANADAAQFRRLKTGILT